VAQCRMGTQGRPVVITYTDLVAFHKCPRSFQYGQDWQAFGPSNEAVTTGSILHEAICAHFGGQDWETKIQGWVAGQTYQDALEAEKAGRAAKRASDLLRHYLKAYVDYLPLVAELEMEHEGIGGHVDLVALLQGQLTLMDFKTTATSRPRRYDMSGQLDYYAVLYTQVHGVAPDLIAYDVISEDGYQRHHRGPNWQMGGRMVHQALNLEVYLRAAGEAATLDDPHYSTACDTCAFVQPCSLRTHDGQEAEAAFLAANYKVRH
jgi:hypothetical protein